MNKSAKLIIIVILLSASAFILNSCGKSDKKTAGKKVEIKKSFYSMGTFWEIKVISTNKNKSRDLKTISLAIKRVRKLDGILSDFKPSSNVSLINKYSGIKPIKANPDLLKLLKLSLKFYRLTDNSFDVAIGPVMKIWGFYDKKYTVPDETNIKKTIFLSNPQFIKINGKTVFLEKKGMMIDFGGDGEGYGIDEALFVLKKYGIKNALVNGGGQITAIGKDINGKRWSVGLLDPLNRNKIIKVIKLTNASVETSANYENRFFYKGKYYGHIMNPITGTPVKTNTLSDTVIVENKDFRYPSTVADALSCSFFILNKNRISAVIKKLNKPLKVIIIKKMNKSHLKIYALK
ncbi:MAG: FAD:protein FMN transferase [Candidatus Acidulodesulfobacterium ferriphilum]|jgi:Membrane-associated lipoprotein involved in thiamine biosynthesis|uniref:FAD:protein FMN transferase n=1 Tax=Candidatus Acidulodesulfobacterium ferriphilum TaxID=2597223 RepID=A0A519BDU3_9DELT|nr:MAG: FAD:protein FMN transferase [Candidatus Acidulodesulfobacterium ferriphilum]